MPTDPAAWIAAEAGFPLLEESSRGRIRANDAGLALLRGHHWTDLVDAALVIVGLENDAPTRGPLARLVESARRRGLRGSIRLGDDGWVCLVAPQREGRARLLLVPGRTAGGAEVERHRAAVQGAAEVSHEVANALGAISGLAGRARRDVDADGDPPAHPVLATAARALRTIEGRAQEAQETSRKLLATVRREQAGSTPRRMSRPTGDPAAVPPSADPTAPASDLSALLQEVAELLAPLAERREIRVDLLVEPGLPVPARRSDLFTIVWNLAKNALEALPDGGRVHLGARLDERTGFALLWVEDDGPGIPETQIPKLFEPYFTTKAEGTGLGLPLVHRTVVELGGRIALDTAPGRRGTRFTVHLPALPPASQPAPPSSSTARKGGVQTERDARTAPVVDREGPVSVVRPQGRSPERSAPAAQGVVGRRDSGVLDRPQSLDARVLVLDDDVGLRELLETTLTLRGAQVVAAEEPTPEVLAQGPFDVAIVDQRLGSLNGDRVLAGLAPQVRRRVLMSGGSMPPGASHHGPAPDAWLRKPFDPDEVVGILRRLLESDASDRTAVER
jgi:signal transduction histidine kinase/CheY-like chemotaxis protein